MPARVIQAAYFPGHPLGFEAFHAETLRAERLEALAEKKRKNRKLRQKRRKTKNSSGATDQEIQMEIKEAFESFSSQRDCHRSFASAARLSNSRAKALLQELEASEVAEPEDPFEEDLAIVKKMSSVLSNNTFKGPHRAYIYDRVLREPLEEVEVTLAHLLECKVVDGVEESRHLVRYQSLEDGRTEEVLLSWCCDDNCFGSNIVGDDDRTLSFL